MLGYDKLTSFLRSLNNVELYRDDSKLMPVVYVRECKSGTINHESNQKQEPGRLLYAWAFMGYLPRTFKRLREMALEEDWGTVESNGRRYYPTNDKGEEVYPILSNYLTYTFYKLYRERDKYIFISKDGANAVFNTGLVDRRYKPIYALFGKNRTPSHDQEWYLIDFCIEGEDMPGKTLVAQFPQMPQRANYFSDVTDLLYDTRMDIPILDDTHIIVERMERLPYEFVKNNAPRNFDIQDISCMSEKDRRDYYSRLKEAVKNDPISLRQITERVNSALKVSIERIKWNYKSAIPMYYPKRDKMGLFLPLCLVQDNKVDVALVVEKTASGRYQGATIYELGWAYKCARLICRPDSDWLTIAATNTAQVALI